MEHWRRTLPNPMLTIHYEALVSNPEAAQRLLLQFLELDGDQLQQAPLSTRGPTAPPMHPSHTPTGFPELTCELIGFGQRFEHQMQPMMAAYWAFAQHAETPN